MKFKVMKRLKEKAAYQWRVLRWRGVACMVFILAGVLCAFACSVLMALYAAGTDDGIACAVALLCAGFALMLTWCANAVWEDFEKRYYKRACSGDGKDFE